MTYGDEEIARQLRLGEDSHWEFKSVEFAGDKPKSPRRGDLADEIAAFANADGGVLLCGVTDGGAVEGMSRARMDELERLVAEVCADSIEPPIYPVILRRESKEGAPFLLVSIPPGYAQHDSPGGSYRRVGSSRRRMTADERLRLAQRRGQARFLWFDKQIVPGTGFGTLDRTLWSSLLSAEGAANPEPALEKMALLAPDEAGVPRATVAGILLCTQNPENWLPNARISAARYRGTDRASGQVDAQEIAGPLNRQIAGAVAFAIRNMQVSARKDPARADLPQYSDKALFEAVVNAVAHRDYAMRSSAIRLSMFADRLEIQSPGSLPNTLTVESMEVRQATRNEALASALGRMPVDGVHGSRDRRYFMERRGDGVPVIVRETRELCGRPPEYRTVDGAELLLTVPAAEQERSPASVVVTVRSAGAPAPGADVLLLFPNKTWTRAATDDLGEARVDLHATHLPMTVFAASPGCAARLERGWIPAESALALELEPLPEGGSAIFPESTGSLPGLAGRLNPVRDTLDRTYLYASNIAIEDGRQQPVDFVPGEDLRLTDSGGRTLRVRILDVAGRSALLEYRPDSAGGRRRA